MGIEYLINLEFCLWIAAEEFLIQLYVLVHYLGPLDVDILFHKIRLVDDGVS